MDIKDIRNEIDQVDKEILELLNKRFKLASDVIEFKKLNNLPIENKQREEEIIKMIGESVDVEINDEVIEIYKEIMKQSKVYQSKK